MNVKFTPIRWSCNKSMKKNFYIGLLVLLSSAVQADIYPSIHEGKNVEANGFECADNVIHLIPYLGRGSDFPDFLIQDIESELKRQVMTSHLLNIKCLDEAQLIMSGQPVDDNNEQTAISTLSITFLLNIEVGSTDNFKALEVEQNYTVENLGTSTLPTLTQNFNVKSRE
jgi:hypothetical protein